MGKYFVYYLFMSVFLFIFMYLGGNMLYSSFHQENYKAQAELHQFSFGYLSPEASIKNNLFHLELVFDTLHFEKNYYYKQCNPIKKFLSTKGLLPNTSIHPVKDITEILPVKLNDKQLEDTKVVYHVNAKKNLEYLRLDTIELVGHEKGPFEKILSAVAGILIFLTAIFLFLVLSFLLKKQIEAYNENKDIENFEISLKWKWRKDTPGKSE